MSTFVTVGNAPQPFDRLLKAVQAVTPLLPRPVVVQRGASSFSDPDWMCHDFFSMADFENLIRSASVLIMHCGAGSVVNAVRDGHNPIVMPRLAKFGEHIDDHQLEFAEALSRVGYVRLVVDAHELRKALTAMPAGGAALQRAVKTSALVGALSEVMDSLSHKISVL